jgi:hypothetical protein
VHSSGDPVFCRFLLPELTDPPVEAYFVYPDELRASKRISVFRDFLIRKVGEQRQS